MRYRSDTPLLAATFHSLDTAVKKIFAGDEQFIARGVLLARFSASLSRWFDDPR
jgi:hypothetical protein